MSKQNNNYGLWFAWNRLLVQFALPNQISQMRLKHTSMQQNTAKQNSNCLALDIDCSTALSSSNWPGVSKLYFIICFMSFYFRFGWKRLAEDSGIDKIYFYCSSQIFLRKCAKIGLISLLELWLEHLYSKQPHSTC